MIHYYNYQPESDKSDQQPDKKSGKKSRSNSTSDQHTASTPYKHPLKRFLKVLLAIVLILLLIIGLAAAIIYFYVTQGSIDNTDGRTNIVFLGVDEAASLSDTIMIVSIDDIDGDPDVAMVSVPRDLWVDVPGFGGSKINAAYSIGERNQYPGGGPGLTRETLESVLGIDIHYYSALGFDDFVALIDAAGGVEIEVENTINDPRYPAPEGPGYSPLLIEAGAQHFDGETALKYARSRQSTNDFDRAFRQQQIVLALRDQVVSDGNLPQVQKITNLITTLDTRVDTDMSRAEVLQLAATLRNTRPEDVPQYVIDTSNFLTGAQFDGSSLVPRTGNFDEIQSFVNDVFSQDAIDEYESMF